MINDFKCLWLQAQLRKCEKLLDADEPEIVIHGLGAAITKACELALKIKEIHHGTIDLDVNTSTVDLIGEFLIKTVSEKQY